MSDLAPVERRLQAALDRIGRQLEKGPAQMPAQTAAQTSGQTASRPAMFGLGTKPESAPDPEQATVIASLREALEKERASNAQLSERVHQVKQRQETTITQLERRLARLTEQLDLQSLEMLRLKRANTRLIESNTALREAQIEGFPDATLINRSISAELEALQAERRAEMAEMEEILAELKPLVAADAR